MDDDNMKLWDRLFSTDPSQTKTFRRAGGFSGTAIKPFWCIMRATEEFGPAGKGWGWNELEARIFEAKNGQAIWFSKIEVWYVLDGSTHRVGPQWGATELVAFRGENKNTFVDEEAAKKAITDGITKCLSYLGLAGDVHMGLFDDSKYVAERKIEERKEKEAAAQEERKAKVKPKPEPSDDNAEDRMLDESPREQDKDDPQNVEDRNPVPKPDFILKRPRGNGGKPLPSPDGYGVQSVEHQPSERAWLENVRSKIAKISDVKELIAYWDSQKPMATKVAEGAQAEFATTALELARAKIKALREGGAS